MEGEELLETFNSLGINTANVSKVTINAFFDTDCAATKEMLHWLCKNLTKDNVLTACENEEYEQLLKQNIFLPTKEYEIAMTQLQSKYPGILDYEDNLLEVEWMEDELSMLQDKECHLEHLLNINECLSKKLSKEIDRASKEEIVSTVKRQTAQEKCLEHSYKLDDAHEKLQQQIFRYAEHLNEFEHAARPSFISNVPMVKYTQYYSDIVSYLDLLIRKESVALSKAEMTVKSAKKKLLDTTLTDAAVDQLEVLRHRIFNSTRNYLYKQMTEEKLRAETIFLKTLNLSEVLSGPMTDTSLRIALEANIFSREELLERVSLDLENVAQQVCDQLIDRPKIILTENAIRANWKKLESLTQLHNKVVEILAKHMLLSLLHQKEKNDIHSTDIFFRDVYHYITHNLQNCQTRIEAMSEIINEHVLYKTLPMGQRFKILSTIVSLVTDGEQQNLPEAAAVDAIKNFGNDCSRIEQQVFFSDFAEHLRLTRQIEQDLDIMRKFLVCGPTNRIVVIPHHLVESFNKVTELLETQKAALKSAMQIVNDAEKNLAEKKWLRIRRQLWMWFILEPKRVLNAVDLIETAVKQKRREAV